MWITYSILIAYFLIYFFWIYSISERAKSLGASFLGLTIKPLSQALQGGLFAYLVIGGLLVANLLWLTYHYESGVWLLTNFCTYSFPAGGLSVFISFCAMLVLIVKKNPKKFLKRVSIIILTGLGLVGIQILLNIIFPEHKMPFIIYLWRFFTSYYVMQLVIWGGLLTTLVFIHKYATNRTLREMNVYNFLLVVLPYSLIVITNITKYAFTSGRIIDASPILMGGN